MSEVVRDEMSEAIRAMREWELSNWHEGGARGVVVIVVGNGHGNTSSNPGRDWLHFT